jgi:redox-sensitive bicupin YhaK (pirin superfamily)
VALGGARVEARRLAILEPQAAGSVVAEVGTTLVLLGGARLDGDRHIYWNFVSSSRDRIEQAKEDWREGRFPRIPGDPGAPIPLPE